MTTIRILPEAFEDLSEAVDWYNDRRDGLGYEFEELFYSSVLSIQKNPNLDATVYRAYRRHLFRRFPYSVYYRIHQKEVIVTLIFHLARNPMTLRRLLRNREKLN